MPKSKRKSAEKTSTPSSTTAPAASAGKPSELQPVDDVLEPASHPPGMGTGQSFGEIPGPSPMNGLSPPMQPGPPTPLRFENYSNNVERRLKRQSTGAAMCDVPVFLVGDHMAIVIPGYGSRGYLKTLGNAIALCKTRPYEMRGFKLAPGVGTDPGRSIYGYFGFYRDAKEAMEHAFDAHSNAKISKDVLVGPNDPFAKPPKVPVRYDGRRAGDLAQACRPTIQRLGDTGGSVRSAAPDADTDLITLLRDHQGARLLSEYQHYAMAIGAAVDCDFGYLQRQQDQHGGLVPNHPVNGYDIKKFFEVNNFWDVDA